MVSKARDDLPEPESPVMTTSLFRGISREIFLRLCCLAPLMEMMSIVMGEIELKELKEFKALKQLKQLKELKKLK